MHSNSGTTTSGSICEPDLLVLFARNSFSTDKLTSSEVFTISKWWMTPMFRAKNAESRTTLVTGIEYQVHKAWFFCLTLILVLGLAIINCADLNLFLMDVLDTLPLKPTKTEPSFRKLNSPPTKLCMLFPAHLQARELCPQTYSLSLLLEWSQVTHIPASIKLGGAYKPESQLSTVPLPDNCVMVLYKNIGLLQPYFGHLSCRPVVYVTCYKLQRIFLIWFKA